MTGAVVRKVRDLAAHPQGPVAGEGLGERTLDARVDLPDGEDVGVGVTVRLGVGGALPAGTGPALRGGGLRRSLGVEELAGATGHRRHPTDGLHRHRRSAGGGTIGGDGESAGWPRHGPHAGPCRGRSGLRRAGCWLTASRGDPQDSATERKPPMAGCGPHRQG